MSHTGRVAWDDPLTPFCQKESPAFMISHPSRVRFPLMACGLIALLTGLWAGLMRLGWESVVCWDCTLAASVLALLTMQCCTPCFWGLSSRCSLGMHRSFSRLFWGGRFAFDLYSMRPSPSFTALFSSASLEMLLVGHLAGSGVAIENGTALK
jgi:hypothetical protein